MNYQNRGLCYLPKPKAEAVNTDTRYEAAQDFIKKDPARNCCTVGSSKQVSRWQLPPKAEVQLRRVSDDITFYYDSTKMSPS